LPEAPSGRGGHFCITLQVEKQKCGRGHHMTQLFKPVFQEKLNMKVKFLKTFFYIHYLATKVNHLIENLVIFSLLFSELWL
jgi:hypothetical protein